MFCQESIYWDREGKNYWPWSLRGEKYAKEKTGKCEKREERINIRKKS
jgi:hypothetical protein